jgi:hypothetical protein
LKADPKFVGAVNEAKTVMEDELNAPFNPGPRGSRAGRGGLPRQEDEEPEIDYSDPRVSAQIGLQGLGEMAKDPKLLAEAMESLKDPEIAKEVQKMMADPAFQAEMKKITESPSFKKSMEKAAHVMEDMKEGKHFFLPLSFIYMNVI